MIKAYAVHEAGGKFEPFEYDPGELGDEQVEIDVEYCGICHSDLSMVNNEWGISQYPLVPGHEAVGKIAAVGSQVQKLKVGQRVGLGWYADSCMHCEWCLSGDQNLCLNAEGTIVGRYGAFAEKVRGHQNWVVPLPDGLDAAKAGPLFCGGITVFNPIVQFDVQPTDKVGVIGIGGLGHLALGFLSAWGCDVTAFSSSPDKEAEAKKMGANHFINSKNPEAIAAAADSFDFIISTVAVDLDWNSYVMALRPRGRLHFVGVVPNPISTPIFPLIMRQRSISASPLGSPTTVDKMLDFATRHNIQPITETYSFDRINEAMDRLHSGQARYRVVLEH
jgi:alcohol/geraniol dehydrogenase (NADP+)